MTANPNSGSGEPRPELDNRPQGDNEGGALFPASEPASKGKWLWGAVLVFGLIFLAYGIGRWTNSSRQKNEQPVADKPVAKMPANPVVAVTPSPAPTLTADDIKNIIRKEIEASKIVASTQPVAVVESPVDKTLTANVVSFVPPTPPAEAKVEGPVYAHPKAATYVVPTTRLSPQKAGDPWIELTADSEWSPVMLLPKNMEYIYEASDPMLILVNDDPTTKEVEGKIFQYQPLGGIVGKAEFNAMKIATLRLKSSIHQEVHFRIFVGYDTEVEKERVRFVSAYK